MNGTAYDRILDKLRANGAKIIETRQGQAQAQCPAHEDHNPSLSVRRFDTRTKLHCFAGCDDLDILHALDLEVRDLYDNPRTEYRYADRTVIRSYDSDGGRKFTQRVKPGSSGSTLYRLDAVQEAVAAGRTVYLVEGEEDVHALESVGIVATTAPQGASNFHLADVTPLQGATVVAIADRDQAGKKWAETVAAKLTGVAADIQFAVAKTGKDVSDHLTAGHTVTDLQLVEVAAPEPDEPARPDEPVSAAPMTLTQAHDVFRRWLGDDYDLDALDAMLAAAAVERLDGDPVWLLIISGSGNAKTETVQALAGIGAHVASTIASEGALLSGSPRKEHGHDSTGGLLREVGGRGVLVIKDVTSILSMQRDLRGQVLGALREIHDGQWTRKVGTDGGRSLPWSGRIAVIGAVTTAWDQAHAVIASMGDRFVLVRVDSTVGRQKAGRQAIGNTGTEPQMRAELAEAVAGVIAGMNSTPTMPTSEETEALLAAADLVTLARTGVEYDYRGDVIDAHAPEMPTRFAKELAQILRGAIAIGIDRTEALRLAMRCARDSMPPLRLAIIEDLADHPNATTAEVRKRLNKPRATVDRQLQALHMLGVLDVEEEETEWAGRPATRWYYSVRADLDPEALNTKSVPEKSVGTLRPLEERETEREVLRTVPDISGTDPTPATPAGPEGEDCCRVCHRPNLLTPASVQIGVCVVCRKAGAA